MVRCVPRRGVVGRAGLAAACLASIAAGGQAPSLEVFQVFLKDGRVLHSHGECATLPDDLVCVVRLEGGQVDASHDVLTVPRELVDEERTGAYARAVRARAYGNSRGEREYAELTADLSRVLTELEQSDDRDRRLGIAQMARARIANWSDDHFGYKAAETSQLVALFDGVIAELRVAAGQTTFSLDLIANMAPAEEMALLPAPDVTEALRGALTAADVTRVAAERLAILRSAQRVASAATGADPEVRNAVASTLKAEEAVERRYRALMEDAIARADVAVRHGRASVMQRLIWEVEAADRDLGSRRPREMAAFGRRLAIELDLAMQQQAAYQRWEQVKDTLLAYELRLRPIFDKWVSQRRVLRALTALTVPSPSDVDTAQRRFGEISRSLSALRPLPELREVHAVLQSATQMAQQGLILGERLTVADNAAIARNASSVIAGAELLLDQARRDLVVALNPRKVR